MRDTWKWALVVLVAILLVGCDTDGTGDNPNCAEDTVVEDDTWESPDSEITSTEDSGSSEECVPTIPEGAKVKCEDWCCVYTIHWDMEACTASAWKQTNPPTPIFEGVPPEILISSSGHSDFYCTPIDE